MRIQRYTHIFTDIQENVALIKFGILNNLMCLESIIYNVQHQNEILAQQNM